MAGLWKQVRDVNKAVMVFNDTTLVGFGAQVQSGFIDVSQYEDAMIGRTVTGGTYAFEIDWSADGSTVLMTESITTTNATTKQVFLAAPYARFRVKNTDGAANFTAHRTWVCL